MRLGRAVADIDLVVGRLQQRLAARRGQALTQHHRIALAMFEAFDADLLVLAGYRRVGGAGDRDIGREVGLAGERLGEVETDARISRFIVDLVIDDAEAVFLAQVFVSLADVLAVAPLEAGAVGFKRGAPVLMPHKEIGEQGERARLIGRAAGALIGGIGRRGRALHQLPAPVRLRVVGGGAESREGDPVDVILRRGGDGGAKPGLGALVVARADGGFGVAAQLLRAASLQPGADGRALLAQGFGEPHRVAGEILALIGLAVGGRAGGRRRAQGRGENEKGGEELTQAFRHGASRLWTPQGGEPGRQCL